MRELLRRCTDDEVRQVTEQLGREPRGMVSVAAYNQCGEVLVVVTSLRIPEPFPTTYYLTHPEVVKAVSRLEASGYMRHLNELLDKTSELYDEQLAVEYARAHRSYIEDRNRLSALLGLEPLKQHDDFSAGGMPNRVKCLHALVGHSLAKGYAANPVGDLALEKLQAQGFESLLNVLQVDFTEVEN
ncbi:MAG: DUF501 domain-containing protein [Candidatus Ancillula trichonymphae]|nr:DUF501 domain-containing protein [Candidatus Ancillula trichonymphae]